MLVDNEMVIGLPKLKQAHGVCEGCAVEIHHRKAFSREMIRKARHPSELIHSNVCGPMQVTTPSGNRHFLSL